MKKSKVIATLALGTLLAGCASDDIVNEQKLEELNGDGRISFVKKNTNMTRADQRAETVGHYEFGVWGFKGAAADKMYTDGDIMTNYLVAYGDNQTGNVKNYKQLSVNATTYGADAKEGTTTVAPDGISTWYYEGLGSPKGSHKEQSSPAAEITPLAAQQVLKYWDQSQAYHNYFAYMPYFGTQNGTQSVTIADAGSGVVDMTFNKIGTFYTDPADVDGGAQIAANTAWAGTYNASSNRDPYNTEIINANEANYAAAAIAKANYKKDVPLTFKHVNAKIKVAIWEAVPGYKVELINLVNDKVVAANANISAEYKDLAFTPATKAQAIEHNNKQQLVGNGSDDATAVVKTTTPLPKYPKTASIKAASVTTGTVSALSYVASSTVADNANLRFTIASDDAVDYTFRAASHKRISEVGGTSATVLNTTHYVLPNHNGANYITEVDADYPGTGGTDKLGESTGYTLHVSYRLLPEDGSAPTEVYDARVWVAPEFCKWQGGKQYTYIFKITTSSNGTTDPNAVAGDIFNGSGETNPYIDPEDPRVPEDPALVPIVFDGIQITDYDAVLGFKDDVDPDDDTWQISNVESWPSLNLGGSTYDVRYCNYLTTAEVYAGALDLSNHYYQQGDMPTVDDATPGAYNMTFTGTPTYTFNYSNAVFKPVTSGTVSYTYAELKSSATWSAVNDFSNGTAIPVADVKAVLPDAESKAFATYIMNIWSNATATTAQQYTATPQLSNKITVTPTLLKEVVDQTDNNKAYKTVKTYTTTSVVSETKYYKANGLVWDEITKTAYDAVIGGHSVTGSDAKVVVYNFKFDYAIANDNYEVTTAVAAPVPTQAYGIVKK